MPAFTRFARRAFTALAATLLASAPASAQQRVDILIAGGSVVDGTGSPARRADLGITGDRITFVGDASAARVSAARTIDAHGLVVAPGFIDSHTHSAGDLSSAKRKSNLDYLMQGVTTVVTNNDGGGPVDIAKQVSTWQKNGIGTNAAVFVGFGSVRQALLGMSANAPTAEQLDSMRALVARGMDAGAIGLSTGLFYAPQSYSTTDEVIALAKVAAAKGGLYDTHLRDESSYTVGLIGAVNEAIRIGREAHMPVQISHIKALGADVWGLSDSVITLMKHARADGESVFGCQYPYTASGTSLGASLLPRWAETGGADSLRARAADPAIRTKLLAEMTENLRRRGGASTLLITSTRDSSILGKRLDAIARERNTTPVEAALSIIVRGDPAVASFNMTDQDIDTFMVQPFVVTCSDGSEGHPRKYGTFPRILRQYVYTNHELTLPEAIARSSATTAKYLGFKDRGVLAPGAYADVIAFDPATVSDRSTYQQPTLLATGMKYVLVNGVLAIENSAYTGALSGRVLHRE
ncbi:MAG TPA: amidohydrolase family protein [Gemmatimonadaceae bacterium]|nr:amidohydrolase family protein [Gemmatimonadaceae bacterium]